MKMSQVAHKAIRNLAVVGLLLMPFSLSHAAELVGKPVPVGGGSVSSTATSSASSAPLPPEAPSPMDVQSAQQDIHEAMEDMRHDFHDDFDSGFKGFNMGPDVIVPVVGMLLLFGGPMLLVITLTLLHYRAKARRQKNINANIDKLLAAGKDIPIELLLGEEPAAVKRSVTGEVTVYHGIDDNMRKGVRNIGLGVGWLIFLTIMFGIKIGAFGFVFIGLGISQVVIWKLSGPAPVSNLPTADINRVQD